MQSNHNEAPASPDMALDPVVAQYLETMQRMQGNAPAIEQLGLARAFFSAFPGDTKIEDPVEVEDIEIDGVPVRLYRPPSATPLPLHIYFHAGGFILGTALGGGLDGPLSRRALATGSVVASIDYRLAPENPFPAGVEDGYTAIVGLGRRFGEFGLAPGLTSVGGASSGGNFAAVVALMSRDRSGPPIFFQLLEIAGTDLTKSSHAWRNPAPGHDTTREADLGGVDLYLPDLPSRAHPYASPLFAPDLGGLPPAYVMNAEWDPRRDECEAYVIRLQDAGVAARARTMAGHVHGSLWITDWEGARHWEAEANRALQLANEAAVANRPVRFS